MNIEFKDTEVVVTKEFGDKKRFNTESALLHAIKKEIQSMGHDVIKKRMWKDGHLYGGDAQQYIRERSWKFAIYDGDYALRSLHKAFNKNGQVTLLLDNWEN